MSATVRCSALLLLTLGFPNLAGALPVPEGGEILVNGITAGAQDTPVVALDPRGGFVVAYESDGPDGSFEEIFARRFDAAGVPVGNAFQVNTTTVGFQEDPSIAIADDGGFVIVWDSGETPMAPRRIVGRRFDPAGVPDPDELAISPDDGDDHNDAVVAITPTGFVVAWEHDFGGMTAENVVARRFDASGVPLSDELALSATSFEDQEDVAMGVDATGAFVAVWESQGQDGSEDTIIARRFDASGAPLSGEIVVNGATIGDQQDPDLAVDATGRFVVVWEDDFQDPTGIAVMVRFFDALGVPESSEHQVDGSDAGDQIWPSVVFDGRRALVAWDSGMDQDGSGRGIFCNRVDADGTVDGVEQQVNTTTDGGQVIPTVATDGQGRFVIAWDDNAGNDGDSRGVYAQRFSGLPFADGFESGGTDAWSLTVP